MGLRRSLCEEVAEEREAFEQGLRLTGAKPARRLADVP